MAYLATIAPFGFPDFNPLTLFPLYKRFGCVTTQFYRNTRNPPNARDARKLVEDLGMPFDSMHGVFGPQFDPSSPDETVRKFAVETYKQEGELALLLGGPVVVVHPAPIAPDMKISLQQRAQREGPFQKSLDELAVVGESQGVVFVVENLPGNYYFGSDPVRLAQIVRKMNHPNIRMCFDTGHAHMTGPVAAALDAGRDVITYLHVHDNNGFIDSHHVPGRGNLPWDEQAVVMKKLPRDIPAMLELFETEAVIETEIAVGLPEIIKRWLSIEEPAMAR